MTVEVSYIVAAIIWWSFAVVIFSAIRSTGDEDVNKVIVWSVFWPIGAVLGLVVAIWRMPFKTAKQIHVDIRNRKIVKEFNEFMKQRETLNEDK